MQKLGQLRGILKLLGFTEAMIHEFAMRSLRSGAAGQTCVNLTSSQGGIPKDEHLKAIARLLGHATLSAATLHAYIGPLAKKIYENSNVVMGIGEGSKGGVVNYEACIAPLKEYEKFAKKNTMDAVALARGARKRAIQTSPNLPPSISALVEADHDVQRSLQIRDRDVGVLVNLLRRESLIAKAGSVKIAPALLGPDYERIDVGLVKKEIGAFNEVHTAVRRQSGDRVKRRFVLQLGAEAQGVGILQFTPALLKDALGSFKWYLGERKRLGESAFAVFR